MSVGPSRSASGMSALRWIALSTAFFTLCLLLRTLGGPSPATAQSGAKAKRAPTASKQPPADTSAATTPVAGAAGSATGDSAIPEIVAVVNGADISRNELGKICLWHFGTQVLESVVNKTLIAEHCRMRNVQVTDAEIQEEINRTALRFGAPRDQFLALLKQERGISPGQYAGDIIWPTVALRKLAADRLQVTKEDILQAYETQFGPAVKVRLIACADEAKARKVHADAMAHPEEFGNLAKQFSDDVNSASAKGLIQPIRKHLGDPQVEAVAFALEKGQISKILKVGEQFVFLKCEEHLAAEPVPLEGEIEKTLSEAIRDKKMRLAADDIFRELQSTAKVENIYNDPARRQQMPGVAAVINGRKISVAELTLACIERHGTQLLEAAINRRLIEQELKRRKIELAQNDLDEELARTAVAMGKTKSDNSPDVAAWLAQVRQETGLESEVYIHDTVWPAAALKKLVGNTVEVTEEDLQKGYEANYGPRVRCRAILLNNQRRAQEVWEMARKQPTIEYFGDLAEQYSVEASSRALRGEVPPIQKWGGEPVLEKEAFGLKPGELSGIVQIGEQFVILMCEDYTKPIAVDMNEVRPMLLEDLYEKKLRLAMATRFEEILERSQIDNYLAQTSRSPKDMRHAEPSRVSLTPREGSPPAAQSLPPARGTPARPTSNRR